MVRDLLRVQALTNATNTIKRSGWRTAALLSITALVCSFIPPITVSAAGETISGGTTINGETDSYIPITGLSVSGGSGTVPVSVSVSRGQLSMTTTTGLTFTSATTGTKLDFSGSQADVNAALATLRYRTVYAETVQITASISSPGEVYFPGNGHLYEIVEDTDSSITANDARTAAESLTKYGATGYLATITTAAENEYVGSRLSGDGWFGASDAGTEGDWKWVTGPEAGTSFWSGLADGAPVGSAYSNWASGEPNDSPNEDCAQFYSNGSGWNDLQCDNNTLAYYVVEYGAPGDMPEVSSTTYNVTTTFPEGDPVPISSCLDLIAVENNALNHRYDDLTLTTNIDCTGETLEPMFDDTDPDFGALGFRGTFDGQGHSITNATLSHPATSNVGLIANTNGATIQNLTLSGAVTGADCTGGLVGSATDTVFDNVTSSVDVTGGYQVGGIVGCLVTTNSPSHVTDNTVSGDVTGSGLVGGLVGDADANNDQSLNITGNTYSGSLAANDWSVGGLVGDLFTDDSAQTVISGNTAGGLGSIAAYTVGGLGGRLDTDDGGTIAIASNTVVGAVSGQGTVGGLAGFVESEDGGQVTITNSATSSNITVVEGYAGGLVGSASVEGNSANTKLVISNSSGTGNVTGAYQLGGLVGEADRDNGSEELRISNSFATGNVTGTNSTVGGLAGETGGMTVENSYATGAVSGTSDLGGLIGEAYDSTVSQSYAIGNVEGTSDRVGGLIGRNSQTTVAKSFATGTVLGISRVGGLTGANGGTIENSYARGDVSGTNNVGSLSGRCGGIITNSYGTGSVDGTSDTGGLVGFEDGCDVTESFWDTETSGTENSVVGVGKTTAEMKTLATFTGAAWNFDNIWGIAAAINDGYPCLQWHSGSCVVSDDEDSDGIASSVENAAPNSGDANNDGTPDAQQDNVASYVNIVTGQYAVLAAPSACSITSVGSQAENINTAQDAGYNYPAGLMNFSLNCGTPGYTAAIMQYYYNTAANGLIVRKYNPNTKAYFAVNGATVDQAVIGGLPAITASYQAVDGGELDIDNTANGTIVDPAGLASQAVGAPNTGLGGRR